MNKRITTALAGGLASLALGVAPVKAQSCPMRHEPERRA